MPNTFSGFQFISMSAEEFMKNSADDFATFQNKSTPNLTESDIINSLSSQLLLSMVTESSYFNKHRDACAYDLTNRDELVKCYQECRKFATKSIIDSLYPVNELEKSVQHLDCTKDQFYILSRVRTNYEKPTVEETAKERTYLSFTLNNQFNLSHFPGLVWYGFRTGITAEMIGLISPYDADTRSWAKNRLELGAVEEYLLDAEDLVNMSIHQQTYSQISIKSNSTTYTGPIVHRTPVKPDCILCINHIDATSRRAANRQKLPILVLHPGKHTLCRIHDLFSTPDLATPHYE